MALFDTDAAQPPKLPPSRRYSLALAHESGKVSRPGDKARKLPPRRKGDPSGDAFDESRLRPSLKRDATPFIAEHFAHRPTGDTAKNPITGDPMPVEGTEGKSVIGLGDYPRDYSTPEPSDETILFLAEQEEIAERIHAGRIAHNAEMARREKARKDRHGW